MNLSFVVLSMRYLCTDAWLAPITLRSNTVPQITFAQMVFDILGSNENI